MLPMQLHNALLGGWGWRNAQDLVANMLKGLLDVVCLAFFTLEMGDWSGGHQPPSRGYKISFPTILCNLVTIFLAQAFT